MTDPTKMKTQLLNMLDVALGPEDYETKSLGRIGCKTCGEGVTLHLGYCVNDNCDRHQLRQTQSFLRHNHYPVKVETTPYYD